MAENQATDYPEARYAGAEADLITGEIQLAFIRAEDNVVWVDNHARASAIACSGVVSSRRRKLP